MPGTTIFDAEQSRKGYWLNQFCMSLMKAENREKFKADERGYLDQWAMTEDQKLAVLLNKFEDMSYAEAAGALDRGAHEEVDRRAAEGAQGVAVRPQRHAADLHHGCGGHERAPHLLRWRLER